ncbi:MAG: rod shape-determining protein MreD, partial [Pseudomonadota bacterium]
MKLSGPILIWLTLLPALILSIIPLPEWARPYRPEWVSLVLIYWCIALPHRIGVSTGFSLGILLDTLTGTLFGQHALSLSLLAYLSHTFHAQLRVMPLGQQAWAVLLLLTIGHILNQVITGATSRLSFA